MISKVSSFFKLVNKRDFVSPITLLLVFVIIFLLFYRFEFNIRMPNFSGEDSFYHVGMAKYILANGISHQFPYLYYTILHNNFVDHQLLFHLILIPFIKIFGDFTGPKLLTIGFVALSFAFLYLLFRSQKLKYSFFYALAIFFVLPADFYFRMAFIRVQAPALFLMVLTFYFIFRRKAWAVGILSFLFVWLYGGFVFLPLIAILYLISLILTNEKVEFNIPIAIFTGALLGLVINPYFPNNIHFLMVQIFQTGLGAKPYSGGEWRPYDTWFWFTSSLLPAIVFFGSIFARLIKSVKLNHKESMVLLFTFCLLILEWKSKRYVEYWPLWAMATGVLLTGRLLEDKIANVKNEKSTSKNIVLAAGVMALVIVAGYYGVAQMNKGISDTRAFTDLRTLRQAQTVLMEKSSKGDIVFTDDWDVFPYYFYLNQKNYYIVGLDPEFMNSYDHTMYEEFSGISSGRDDKSLYKIKTVFNAKWVLVQRDHPQFKLNLENKPELFTEVFSNSGYTLFSVR